MTQDYTLSDLRLLMKKLRDPTSGCPWDKKQSYKSIAPCTIEEAYEVVDAIEKEDFPHLKEELGDLLFQVIFYAQLGEEDQHFDMDSIISSLTSKLIRRHPHIFPDGDLHNSHIAHQSSKEGFDEEEIKENWEKIKHNERISKGNNGLLADIPLGLPALTRAQKLQKRASKQGFDWQNIEGVMSKLLEEVSELQTEIQKASEKDKIIDELGDVFFTCVSMARHLNVCSESVVRQANAKFEQRFSFVESHALEPLNTLTPSQLNALWEQSKA